MYLPFATDPSTSAPMHLKAWFRFVAWSCKSCKSSSIFLESKWVSHAKLPLTTLHPSTSSTIPVTSSFVIACGQQWGWEDPDAFRCFFSESSAASDSCPKKMNPPNFLFWCFFLQMENQRLSGPVSWFPVLQLWLSFLEVATQTAKSPCS